MCSHSIFYRQFGKQRLEPGQGNGKTSQVLSFSEKKHFSSGNPPHLYRQLYRTQRVTRTRSRQWEKSKRNFKSEKLGGRRSNVYGFNRPHKKTEKNQFLCDLKKPQTSIPPLPTLTIQQRPTPKIYIEVRPSPRNTAPRNFPSFFTYFVIPTNLTLSLAHFSTLI